MTRLSLTPFQWFAVGLGVALALIPIVRYFWRRYDRPSKRALEIIAQQEKDSEEAEMWAGIEAQVEAEANVQRELEMRQREKQELAGRTMDEVESKDAWSKLGIDVPIQPVEREVAPPVVLEETEEEDSEIESDDEAEPVKEPDWELVEKMEKLSEPIEGVPDAPDLEELEKENSEESGWADDW